MLTKESWELTNNNKFAGESVVTFYWGEQPDNDDELLKYYEKVEAPLTKSFPAIIFSLKLNTGVISKEYFMPLKRPNYTRELSEKTSPSSF